MEKNQGVLQVPEETNKQKILPHAMKLVGEEITTSEAILILGQWMIFATSVLSQGIAPMSGQPVTNRLI